MEKKCYFSVEMFQYLLRILTDAADSKTVCTSSTVGASLAAALLSSVAGSILGAGTGACLVWEADDSKECD